MRPLAPSRQEFEAVRDAYRAGLEEKAKEIRADLEAKGFKVSMEKIQLDGSIYRFEVTL